MDAETERQARVIDKETGMSPWEAANKVVAIGSVEGVLSDPFCAGLIAGAGAFATDDHNEKRWTNTLINWHARNRWRQAKDEMPPEGACVRVLRDDRYSSENHARRIQDIWANDDWHCDVPIKPADWWQPVNLPPANEVGAFASERQVMRNDEQ